MTARIAPDTSHTAITNPAVTQNTLREPSDFPIASSISANADCETAAFTSGASSSRQTSSSWRSPSMPNANSRNGTIADRIWNEIALADVSRSLATKPSTTARGFGIGPGRIADVIATASDYPDRRRVLSVGVNAEELAHQRWTLRVVC